MCNALCNFLFPPYFTTLVFGDERLQLEQSLELWIFSFSLNNARPHQLTCAPCLSPYYDQLCVYVFCALINLRDV